MNVKGTLFALASFAALVATPLCAQTRDSVFKCPASAQDALSITPSGNGFWVKDAQGHLLAGASMEGKDADKDALKVSGGGADDFVDKDALCLFLDVGGAVKGPKDKAVTRLYGIPKESIASLAGKNAKLELWAKASTDASPCSLFFEGDAGGKHYYKAKDFNIGPKWSKLEVDALLPENLKNLWIRFDCQGAAVYSVAKAAIFMVDASKEAALPAGNLILNGGAERGWYGVATLDGANIANRDGEIIMRDGSIVKGPFSEWSVDSTTAASGKRSFKGVRRSTSGADSSLYFNPVPFELGKPACFSIMMKADRKCQAGMGLFIANGLAYGRNFTIDGNWREYKLEIPVWGKPANGVSMSGDVSSGYGCPLRFAHPRVDIPKGCDAIWIDDARYSMALQAAPSDDALWLRGSLDKPARAYQPGEKVEASCELENPGSSPLELSLTAETFDYFGRKVSSVEEGRLKLAPGETAKKTLSFVPTLLGPFNFVLKAKDSAGGRVYVHSFYMGVFKKAERQWPYLGINVDAKQNAALLAKWLKAFGVGSLRLWDSYDKKLDRSLGLYDAKFYKSQGFYNLISMEYGPFAEFPFVPNDLSGYGSYLAKVFAARKGEIDCYEMLNEVNIWGARKANPDPAKFSYMSPEGYVDTLAVASKALKESDPSAKLAGPATCHTDVSWTGAVLEKGGWKYLDIVTEHPYRAKPEAPDYERDAIAMKALVAKYPKKLPVYADECGEIITASPDSELISEKVRDAIARDIRMQLIAFANGVERYFHFSALTHGVGSAWTIFYLGDPSTPGEVVPNPYLYAANAMMRRIDDAKPLGRVDVGGAFRCYVMERDGRRVVALWKCQEEERPAFATLRSVPDDFKIFDLMGNPVALEKASFAVTPSPCYIESDLSFDELKSLFASASFSGVGLPFSSGVSVVSPDSFSIDIENRINKPISGGVELSAPAGVLAGASKAAFKDLAPGSTGTLLFKTAKPIGLEPISLKVKTVLADGSAFDVKDVKLKAVLCHEAVKPLKLDGDLSDWPECVVCPMTAVKDSKTPWTAEDDAIKANARACWRPDGLYLAVEVFKKDFNPDAGVNGVAELFKGDSLQVAFDTLKDGKVAKDSEHLYDDDDFEYDLGLFKGSNAIFRRYAANARHDGLGKEIGVLKGEVELCVKRHPGRVVYEMKFPRSAVSPFRLEAGSSMRWNVIANLNDGGKRIGWMELARGIGQCKSPGDFLEIILVK